MIGWRAIIGHIHPSRAINDSAEFSQMAPRGVHFHTACILGPRDFSFDALREMLPLIEQAAREVAIVRPDVILQCGTPIGMLNGIGTDKEVIRTIEDATGIKATTYATSMVEALRKLQITKIILIRPYYRERLKELVVTFLQDSGIDVVSAVGLDIDYYRAAEASPYLYYKAAKAALRDAPHAGGILLDASGTRTIEVIEPMETDFQKPVISAMSSALWNVLNMAGVREPVNGLGQLLRML